MTAHFPALMKAFCRDERGVTSIEYGVLMVFVAGTLLISLPAVGSSISGSLNTADAALASPAASASPAVQPPAPKQCRKSGGRRGR